MAREIEFTLKSDDLTQALMQLASNWRLICESCKEYISANALLEHRRADRLRVHIHPETGRLFFALDSPRHFYGLVATANIPALEARYYQLPDEETQFESGYENLIEEVRSVVVASLPPTSSESPLRALCEANSLRLTTVVADDLETEISAGPETWGI